MIAKLSFIICITQYQQESSHIVVLNMKQLNIFYCKQLDVLPGLDLMIKELISSEETVGNDYMYFKCYNLSMLVRKFIKIIYHHSSLIYFIKNICSVSMDHHLI